MLSGLFQKKGERGSGTVVLELGEAFVRALRIVDERGSAVVGAAAGSAALWLAPAVAEDQVPAAVAVTVMQPIALRTAVIGEL